MAQTILIVEDSDNATPLEIALGALKGVKVIMLANGRDAINLLHTNSVEIAAVITDLHLPNVDGFEIIRAIRADDRHSRVPIIVVSGDSCPDIPERLRVLGADAFFPKPYSPAEIRHAIKGLLHVS
jgi:two-component system, chemotaxis family, chemotaxis protein CheY